MEQHAIFYPVIGMAFLTLFIGIRMLLLRIKAVKEDGLSPAYFLLNKGGRLSDRLVKTTHHYNNLFEMPVLFYVVTISIFVTEQVDWVYISLAWVYLLTRMAHAYIHTGYNYLRHRLNAFLLSSAVLYSMWIKLLIELLMQ